MPKRTSGAQGDYAAHAATVVLALRQNVPLARERAGLTQEQLGDAVGYSDAWVSQLETGVLVPRADLLAALAEAMGVSVGFLLGEDTAQEDAVVERAMPGWSKLPPPARSAVQTLVRQLASLPALDPVTEDAVARAEEQVEAQDAPSIQRPRRRVAPVTRHIAEEGPRGA